MCSYTLASNFSNQPEFMKQQQPSHGPSSFRTNKISNNPISTGYHMELEEWEKRGGTVRVYVFHDLLSAYLSA